MKIIHCLFIEYVIILVLLFTELNGNILEQSTEGVRNTLL